MGLRAKKISLSGAFLTAVLLGGLFLVFTMCFSAAQNSANVNGVLFADNFQSGNLNAWDDTAVNSPAACYVTVSNTFNGSAYALHSYVPAPNSIVGAAYAYKDFDNYTDLYASCWIKWVSFGDSPTLSRALKLAGGTAGNAVAAVGVKDVNGTFEWALHYRDGDQVYHVAPNASTPLQLNIWYFIEVHGVVNSTSGLAEGWINGEKFESETGLDNQLIGDIYQLRTGLEEGGQLTSVPAEDYINNVTVSTNYIPYTPGFEPTSASPSTTPNLFSPQGIPSPTPAAAEFPSIIIVLAALLAAFSAISFFKISKR